MTAEEMDNMFDVLYNNITSNQAPGLNAYEKSIFLTKAQDEILKNYFNPKSKGNLTQEGFDANSKRQIDFSSLMKTITIYGGDDEVSESGYFDVRDSVISIDLPTDILFIINEMLQVKRVINGRSISLILQVIPISFEEYTRLMSKPYKRPLKYQAWRLLVQQRNSSKKNIEDIILGPKDTFSTYKLRYVRRPNPIIVDNLEGLTIDGKGEVALSCELDPILHEEIVQRAVELAKVSWTSTGQDNVQAVIQAGLRSE